MSDIFELPAVIRSDRGKGASRRLRKNDLVPAILYGTGKEAISLSIPANIVKKATQQESFYSHILTIDVDGKKEKAVLKDMQRHPYKPTILHMDFLRVSSKEAIIMNVPLHFEGEEDAPGVKQGGILSRNMNEVSIKCLPKDLPEHIAIDVSNLEMDGTIHMSEIQLPAGVEHSAGPVDEEHDLAVVSIHQPKEEPVEEEVEETAEGEEAEQGEEASGEAEGDSEPKSES